MLCRKEHMCNTKKYKISTAYLQKTKISSSSPLKSRISLALEILQFSRDLGKKQNQLTFFLTKHFLEKKTSCVKDGLEFLTSIHSLLHIISPVDWLAAGELRRGNTSLVYIAPTVVAS